MSHFLCRKFRSWFLSFLLGYFRLGQWECSGFFKSFSACKLPRETILFVCKDPIFEEILIPLIDCNTQYSCIEGEIKVMKNMFGSPGKVSGLLLRMGQCFFAAASLGVMASAPGFSTATAFWYIFTPLYYWSYMGLFWWGRIQYYGCLLTFFWAGEEDYDI